MKVIIALLVCCYLASAAYVTRPRIKYVTRPRTRYVTRPPTSHHGYATRHRIKYVTRPRTRYVTRPPTRHHGYATRHRIKYVTRPRTKYVTRPPTWRHVAKHAIYAIDAIRSRYAVKVRHAKSALNARKARIAALARNATGALLAKNAATAENAKVAVHAKYALRAYAAKYAEYAKKASHLVKKLPHKGIDAWDLNGDWMDKYFKGFKGRTISKTTIGFKNANQSSTSGKGAENAIDGDLKTSALTRYGFEDVSWWSGQTTKAISIDKIIIYFGAVEAGGYKKLNVSTKGRKNDTWKLCSSEDDIVIDSQREPYAYTVPCNTETPVNFVNISVSHGTWKGRPSRLYLRLAEVKVNGIPSPGEAGTKPVLTRLMGPKKFAVLEALRARNAARATFAKEALKAREAGTAGRAKTAKGALVAWNARAARFAMRARTALRAWNAVNATWAHWAKYAEYARHVKPILTTTLAPDDATTLAPVQ